ncbi:RagB/SusD family nutrient uptake outer membrane protein [Chitinophaga sp. Mgbs1]|uniref:RagB/SusD family nutrient uptake outer membrane protein n=1 Tax=Chitinophaga solisilvae TaxID=1233460 RepID=A0A9Q5D8Y8_9BACT|nr:RagB/SusD family nutrient uptake outer membrane protein [Chitinophaga solisilvae]
MIDAGAPVTSVNGANVFNSDATASALLTGVYARMSSSDLNISGGNAFTSLTLLPGLSADELILFNLSNIDLRLFYTNYLSNKVSSAFDFWSILYPYIYYANTAIEGLSNVQARVSSDVKKQLLGEARFIRAFCYFYLVNLYGDVPLIITTDYSKNAIVPRSPKSEVFQQIVKDLIEAEQMLSNDFLSANITTVTTDRVRPTKWAAIALLSRVYLYMGQYKEAELMSTEIIENIRLFGLDTLNGVFLKNSREAIWQLQPVGDGVNANTGAGRLFNLPPNGPDNVRFPVYLSHNITNSFETGDLRRIKWIDSVVSAGSGTVFYYPRKYKIGSVISSTQEFIMVLRLAEQYLIRAEARVRAGNIKRAAEDLNIIRNRAGLSDVKTNSAAGLLYAIRQERKVELFTEWGDRWLDMKRNGTIDAVMNLVSREKGGSWNTNFQLYPIIIRELSVNKNLLQNPGY